MRDSRLSTLSRVHLLLSAEMNWRLGPVSQGHIFRRAFVSHTNQKMTCESLIYTAVAVLFKVETAGVFGAESCKGARLGVPG